MALIAPVAFAAAGGLLSGGATWGMAAGWLIGSWLFGPKAEDNNKVFDPGEEELPRFNQALRGSTIPILFGTNRVSSQIVWTKNWTVIRKESSSGGGGKGGGSGLGGKQGSQQGEVTYEYKWDLMFHIGMADESMDLYGGWLISERLNGDTVAAILAGADSQWATFNALTRAASDADSVWDAGAIGAQYESGEIGADFDFEDSYYHGAGATGGTFDNWAHFETEEGGPYRWPYTLYVGFKQFNLGSSARVPQITWEVGPGGITYESDNTYIRQGYPEGSSSPESNSLGESYGAIIKDSVTGELYQHYCRSSAFPRAIYCRKLSDGTDITMDTDEGSWEANYTTDWNAIMGTALGTINVSASGSTGVEDRYIHFIAEYPDGNFKYANALFEIQNGSLVMVGAWRCAESGLYPSMYATVNCIGITGAGTDDDAIMHCSRDRSGISENLWVSWVSPSINQMKAGSVDETASGSYDDRAVRADWTGIDRTCFSDEHGSYISRDYSDYGTYVPTFSLLPTPGYDHALLIYIPKADMEWAVDFASATSIETLKDTYPNGVFLRLPGTIGTSNETWDRVDAIEYWNTKFVDTNGDSVFPFTDSCLLSDGVTEDLDNDYITRPQCQRLRDGFGAGGLFFAFWKQSEGDYGDHPSGWITRGRIFLYNPANETFTQYVNISGSIVDDLATDIGTGGTYRGPIFYFDGSASKVYGITFYDSTLNEFHIGTLGNLNLGGGDDVTPPYIIRKILTSPVYGIGIAEGNIDDTSYGEANQYCEAEGIKISVQYRREESALSVIDELLQLYGGFLIDSGGKIKFGLQEYTASPIRTIDNNRLRIDREGESPVTIVKGARQDTYNRVKVNYFDRGLDYRQNFVEISDEVDQDINGVRAQEFPAKFVMSEATALKIGTRALWGNMYARDIFDFNLGPKDADLEPGDVITLVDSYHTELQGGKQVRIVSWQEADAFNFKLRAVEEVQYVNAATLTADNVGEATKNVVNIRPKPMADFRMYELPDEFQGADPQLYVGYRQQSPIMGARLYVSADGVTYGLASDKQPYVISGIFMDGLPLRDPGYIEQNVEVYLMPDTFSGGFNTTTPFFVQKHTLDDVPASGRASGLGNIWAGSEMLAFEGVNLVAQNWYRFDKVYRGWGGTHLQAHNSGDTWWKQAGGIFTQGINQDKIGTLIYYKVTGYNFNGVEYNLSSVDARTYQILGTAWSPQVQAPLATYIQSPASYLTIQSEDLGYIQKKQVVGGGSPVQIEWPQSARESGYGAGGYGIQTYGNFAQDTTSVSYRVEVLSNDLSTVVRCTTVDTTAFNYSVNANSEDWSGWTGNFAVRVTPFNPIGTALRSRIKILELFE